MKIAQQRGDALDSSRVLAAKTATPTREIQLSRGLM